MNELETQNLHEQTIRKSILVLLVKGGIAWMLLALMYYGFDTIPSWLAGTNAGTSLNTATLNSPQTLLHFILNLLFGWLILYVVLSWIFEYYILKKDSILVRRGIIFSHENIYQMEDVKTIEVSEGFWGKIFKIGTVHFYAFRAQKHVYLSNISNPSAVAAEIHALHTAPENVNLISANKQQGAAL